MTGLGQGRYSAQARPGWSIRAPSGGALTTIALRALTTELADPELRLRSSTTTFVTPIAEGALVIDVEVLRRGRVAAQLRARLAQLGSSEPGLEVTATFARDRQGFEFVDATPPDVPGPGDARVTADLVPFKRGYAAPLFQNLEVRVARGADHWNETFAPGPARLARWWRYRKPQRTAEGCFDPLALAPLADTMPPAVVQRLGSDFPLFIAPSLDLTLHYLAPTTSQWILASTWVRSAARGYATAEVELWSERGELCAFGTQVMMFRSVPEGL